MGSNPKSRLYICHFSDYQNCNQKKTKDRLKCGGLSKFCEISQRYFLLPFRCLFRRLADTIPASTPPAAAQSTKIPPSPIQEIPCQQTPPNTASTMQKQAAAAIAPRIGGNNGVVTRPPHNAANKHSSAITGNPLCSGITLFTIKAANRAVPIR